MTREDIIKVANDMAFFASIWIDEDSNEVNDIVKFAKLVAAKEREACAKYLDSQNTAITDMFAAEIRARGEA